MFSCSSVSLGAPIISSVVFLYLQSVLIPSCTGRQLIVVVCVWSCPTFPEVQEKEPKGYSLVHFLGLLTQNKGSHKQHHCSNLATSVLKVQGIFLKSGPNSLWPLCCVTMYTSAGTHSWSQDLVQQGCAAVLLVQVSPHPRTVLQGEAPLQPPTCSHPRNCLLSSLSHAFSNPPLFSSHYHQRGFSLLRWVCSQMTRREICWCLSCVLCLFCSKCF